MKRKQLLKEKKRIKMKSNLTMDEKYRLVEIKIEFITNKYIKKIFDKRTMGNIRMELEKLKLNKEKYLIEMKGEYYES